MLQAAVEDLNRRNGRYSGKIEEARGENGGANYHLTLRTPNGDVHVASLLVSLRRGYPATVAYSKIGGQYVYLKVLDADQLILALREAVDYAVRP